MRYLKQINLKNYKWVLLISIIIISSFSVVIVGSAKESLQSRQLMGVIAGCAGMVLVSFIDYKWILKLQWFIYAISVSLVIFVLFFGKNVNGATRWIDFGFVSFQPSEFIKIFLVIFFAKFFHDRKDCINTWKTIILAIVLIGIPVFFIVKQPDLSTTLSIAFVFVLLLYLSGLSYKIIGIVLAITIPTIVLLFLYVIQPDQILIQSYQQDRILAWLDPDSYADDTAYQQTNSIIAIGSGQLTGKGINNNTTTSVKNGNFISEPQTDFIFAIIGEELGFRGC
ncbi:MAG: FtsW/RodA/SpoVE family cell cycle protein, partial [Eubacteriales bacterium]